LPYRILIQHTVRDLFWHPLISLVERNPDFGKGRRRDHAVQRGEGRALLFAFVFNTFAA
jgi:hypothetical protein